MTPERNKIKVVHIITRFDKGGSAENTFLTVSGLDRNRYDILLIVGGKIPSDNNDKEAAAIHGNIDTLRREGIRFSNVPCLLRNLDPVSDLLAFFALRRIIRDEKPHIVHTHTSKAGILGRLAAYVNNTPVIIHTPHGHIFWGYFRPLISRFFIALEKFAGGGTDRLIMLTEQEQADHIECQIAAPDKFVVIHSGVNLAPFLHSDDNPDDRNELRKELVIPVDAFVVGTIGRLTSIKGQRYLLDAMAEISADFPNIYGIILGEGELRKELTLQTAALGIGGRVIFPGWRNDVARVMSSFDVFALPSLNEGMGRVIVEAMAAGKAVVASDVGGIRNLVATNENGILVPPADAQSLAAAIKDLYGDQELRKRLGATGRQRAKTYTAAAMINKIDALYEEMIRGKHVQL